MLGKTATRLVVGVLALASGATLKAELLPASDFRETSTLQGFYLRLPGDATRPPRHQLRQGDIKIDLTPYPALKTYLDDGKLANGSRVRVTGKLGSRNAKLAEAGDLTCEVQNFQLFAADGEAKEPREVDPALVTKAAQLNEAGGFVVFFDNRGPIRENILRVCSGEGFIPSDDKPGDDMLYVLLQGRAITPEFLAKLSAVRGIIRIFSHSPDPKRGIDFISPS